jgi:DNA invertase Pin-like site-specific DNA recombinase
MKIGYARISTRDQSLSMQTEALKAAGCVKIHEEVASGAKTVRPVLDELYATFVRVTQLLSGN